jgi:malate dehydrogenase (oxaloacetate-decarboxylating)(NADP+)
MINASRENGNSKQSLDYHSCGKAGKISVMPTKPLATQYDLSLAYSPGVAWPSLEIVANPENLYKYTAYGNMVAVITNGTAVLGMGNIGAAAAKPVMEGKAVLFKKFADIDAIDLEIDTEDPDEFINVVKYLGKSFAGINLEDIKAPECFMIEERLKELMDIPVFHDDQHGTAIIVAAGLINAAYLTSRELKNMRITVSGAGAAALACIELLIEIGVNPSNVILCDTQGVIYKGRTTGMNPRKNKFAISTEARTLEEAIINADVFLGLSTKGAVSKKMIGSMNKAPIIFAMANPDPEISPKEVLEVRRDAIIATGRSDYNNQVNNVMGFPYIFRAALDVRAVTVNSAMKIAAARSLAMLARTEVPIEVYDAYPDRKMSFGLEYIIPVPFDPRLISTVSVAVAEAAVVSGVARIQDFDKEAYKLLLETRMRG